MLADRLLTLFLILLILAALFVLFDLIPDTSVPTIIIAPSPTLNPNLPLMKTPIPTNNK